MDIDNPLVHRYYFGSNDISLYIAGPRRAFYLDMPRSINQFGQAVLANHKAMQRQLETLYADYRMTQNEMRHQYSILESTMAQGFSDVVDAIGFLESHLCAELSEIKLILSQIDAKLADLLHLVKFPRETEANELIEDGVKASAASNWDDAEHCFQEAVQRKRTSFQAHLNLGFVLLHKNDAKTGVEHFKKAVDYVPESPNDQARIQALECYGRACFASTDFALARELQESALNLRRKHNVRSFQREYQYATYCAQSGYLDEAVAGILGLCREQPAYFNIAGTDQDLAPVRLQLLPDLEELSRSEHKRAMQALEEALRNVEKVERETKGISHVGRELERLCQLVNDARAWLGEGEYSNSVRSLAASRAANESASLISNLAGLRDDIEQASRVYEEAKKEVSQVRFDLQPKEDRDDAKREQERRIKAFFDEHSGCFGCLPPILVIGVLTQYDPHSLLSGITAIVVAFLCGFGGSRVLSLYFGQEHSPSRKLLRLRKTLSQKREFATVASSTLSGLQEQVTAIEKRLKSILEEVYVIPPTRG